MAPVKKQEFIRTPTVKIMSQTNSEGRLKFAYISYVVIYVTNLCEKKNYYIYIYYPIQAGLIDFKN